MNLYELPFEWDSDEINCLPVQCRRNGYTFFYNWTEFCGLAFDQGQPLRNQFKNDIQIRKVMHTKKIISHLEWKMNETASANNTDLVTREDIGIHKDNITFCSISYSRIKLIHSEWPIHVRFANSTAQQSFQFLIFWIIQKIFQMLYWVKQVQVTKAKPHEISNRSDSRTHTLKTNWGIRLGPLMSWPKRMNPRRFIRLRFAGLFRRPWALRPTFAKNCSRDDKFW